MRWRSPLLLTALLATAVLAAGARAAVPAATPSLPGTGPSVQRPSGAVPNRLIVAFDDRAGPSGRQDTRADAGATVVRSLGAKAFQLLRPQPGQTVDGAIATLRRDPDVLAVQRDEVMRPLAVPNDPLFGQEWGLQNIGAGVNGAPAIAGADIGVLSAWDLTIGSPSIVVADIDSGYRQENPDLAPVLWTNPQDGTHGHDFIDGDDDPTDSDLVSGGHGVHTAGIIGAAGNDGIGVTGVAQNVRIMPLRVCGPSDCPNSAIIAAINYAGQHGARVANLSLGGTAAPLIDLAIAQNPQTLFVIAAGNGDDDGVGVDNDGASPDRSYPCINAPAAGSVDNVICVAATNQSDQLASFSNYGRTTVDLGAPGTDILSTYPTFATPLFADDFTANDFASRWTTSPSGAFTRTSAAPLTSFGITNATQPASTPSTVTSTAFTMPTAGSCTLSHSLALTMNAGDVYRFGLVENGTYLSAPVDEALTTPATVSATAGVIAAGTSVQIRFSYQTGSSASTVGAHIDDVVFNCIAPIGQGMGTAFLDGTSMATPMVSGAAALLLSRVPGASVTQVRNAILQTTDPAPALANKTVTGGRLDVGRAMTALIAATTAPAPAAAPTVTTTATIATTTATTKQVTRCVVPKLARRTLSGAKSLLTRAHCRLGKVTKPRRATRLRVKFSTPRAGTRLRANAQVALVLATKKRR